MKTRKTLLDCIPKNETWETCTVDCLEVIEGQFVGGFQFGFELVVRES
jgi:hypothetical protein